MTEQELVTQNNNYENSRQNPKRNRWFSVLSVLISILPVLVIIGLFITNFLRIASYNFELSMFFEFLSLSLFALLHQLFSFSLILNGLLILSASASTLWMIALLITRKPESMLFLVWIIAASGIFILTILYAQASSRAANTQFEKINNDVELILPDSTKLVLFEESWHFVGSESIYYAKVTFDKNDADEFRTNLVKVTKENQYYIESMLENDDTSLGPLLGWNPDPCRQGDFYYGKLDSGVNTIHIICKNENSKYIAYLSYCIW